MKQIKTVSTCVFLYDLIKSSNMIHNTVISYHILCKIQPNANFFWVM